MHEALGVWPLVRQVDFVEVAHGLLFPEGPVVMADGSVLVVEIAAGRVSRVSAGGGVEEVCHTGGGPNGAALGPEGALYICNNGGLAWEDVGGLLTLVGPAPDYRGGSIQVADVASGRVEVLYRHYRGRRLSAPNDLVFDVDGGFYFTDSGKSVEGRKDFGSIYYGRPDGAPLIQVVSGMFSPNGIALSPSGADLYVSETVTGRVWSWRIESPGKVLPGCTPLGSGGGDCVVGLPGFRMFDSMACDAFGGINVGTLLPGAITTVAPASGEFWESPTLGEELYLTNICFGGIDRKTAYVTASGTGKLLRAEWPVPGLQLNFGC
jgi:gluconolactonase